MAPAADLVPTQLANDDAGVPEWGCSPSAFDWQIMYWGGENPRTGHPQQPLMFQYFAKFYSRAQIEQRAFDDCRFRWHRTHYAIRPPRVNVNRASLPVMAA